jgi:hypothetical protein
VVIIHQFDCFIKKCVGILPAVGQEPLAGEPDPQEAAQEQPGHEPVAEDEDGAPAADSPAAANEIKCAWGTMWTCSALECPDGTMHYSSYKPADPLDGIQQQAHTIPSMLCKDTDKEPFQYVVLLKDIQATCARGRVPLGNGANESVFVPYRPVGRHG